jgi:hypothetical protein
MKGLSFVIAALSASRVVYAAPVADLVGTTYFFTLYSCLLKAKSYEDIQSDY